LTYEPISPELVGRKRWLQVGKHAGLHGMTAMLEEYGIKPTEEQAKQILDKVKVIGDQGKKVSDVELLSIASEVLGDKGIKRIVQLTGFSVSTGIGIMPYAFVKLNIDGEDFIGTDFGVGPVDAALNAIQKITGKISAMYSGVAYPTVSGISILSAPAFATSLKTCFRYALSVLVASSAENSTCKPRDFPYSTASIAFSRTCSLVMWSLCSK
jgi:hypothetical protein